MKFIGTDNQLTGLVAVGGYGENPDKRQRKNNNEIMEFRGDFL